MVMILFVVLFVACNILGQEESMIVIDTIWQQFLWVVLWKIYEIIIGNSLEFLEGFFSVNNKEDLRGDGWGLVGPTWGGI